jgi:ferredoxin-NADP reductase/ferredoxin
MYNALKRLFLRAAAPPVRHTVSIAHSGRSYSADDRSTILAAAVDAGIAFPHNCGEGFCGSCKCRVLSGQYIVDGNIDHLVDIAQQGAGVVLACRTRALSDIVVSLKTDDAGGEATIVELRRLDDSIVALRLALAQPLSYKNGQFINLRPAAMAQARSYSIVTPFSDANAVLEFHVSTRGGGEFANWVAHQARVGEALAWDGPHGSFALRPGRRDVVVVTAGAGAGVLWGMLAAEQDMNVQVLALMNRRGSVYFKEAFLSLGARHRVALTEVSGADGLEQAYAALARAAVALARPAPNADGRPLFALCGSVYLVDSVRAALLAAGVEAADIVADAFAERPRAAAGLLAAAA